LIWLAGIVVAGAVVAVLARPAYRVAKSWRAGRLTPSAEAALRAGDWETSGRLVKTLLGLAPRRPDVLRYAAHYCTRLGLPDGMTYWELLLSSPEATRADELAFIEFAISMSRLEKSLPRLQALLKVNSRDRDALRLLVRHLEVAGDHEAMLARAREWMDADPKSREAQWVLGQILVQGPAGRLRDEGARLLWGLALTSGDRSDAAMEQLSRLPWLTTEENGLLLRRLSSRPAEWLVVAGLRLKMFPDQRAPIIGAVAGSISNIVDIDGKAEALAWLADQKAYRPLLEAMPSRIADTNAFFASLRVEGLVQEGALREAEEILGRNTNAFQPFMTACLRASADIKGGRSAQAPIDLQTAIEASHDQPRALGFVAAYANRLNQPRAALSALIRLMRWPPALIEAGSRAASLARSLRDDKAMHTVARQMAEAIPNDEELMTVEAYQACLVGAQPMVGTPRLLAVAPERKAKPWYGPALALSYLREKRLTDALNVFEGSGGSQSNQDPRWMAVYAATLGANQQREAARAVARRIDWNQLSPAEQELAGPWRN
jgi:tetratricopeptide (TPR) repeat protein